jgi:hypothetical protein
MERLRQPVAIHGNGLLIERVSGEVDCEGLLLVSPKPRGWAPSTHAAGQARDFGFAEECRRP